MRLSIEEIRDMSIKSTHVHRTAVLKVKTKKRADTKQLKRLTPKLTKGAFIRDELKKLRYCDRVDFYRKNAITASIAELYGEEV
jgi:hypothetical protein